MCYTLEKAKDTFGLPGLRMIDPTCGSGHFLLTSFDASLAFYLEPLLDRAAWEDPSTPASSTLAHEMAFLARGQWALGHRLVPQFQQVRR